MDKRKHNLYQNNLPNRTPGRTYTIQARRLTPGRALVAQTHQKTGLTAKFNSKQPHGQTRYRRASYSKNKNTGSNRSFSVKRQVQMGAQRQRMVYATTTKKLKTGKRRVTRSRSQIKIEAQDAILNKDEDRKLLLVPKRRAVKRSPSTKMPVQGRKPVSMNLLTKKKESLKRDMRSVLMLREQPKELTNRSTARNRIDSEERVIKPGKPKIKKFDKKRFNNRVFGLENKENREDLRVESSTQRGDLRIFKTNDFNIEAEEVAKKTSLVIKPRSLIREKPFFERLQKITDSRSSSVRNMIKLAVNTLIDFGELAVGVNHILDSGNGSETNGEVDRLLNEFNAKLTEANKNFSSYIFGAIKSLTNQLQRLQFKGIEVHGAQSLLELSKELKRKLHSQKTLRGQMNELALVCDPELSASMSLILQESELISKKRNELPPTPDLSLLTSDPRRKSNALSPLELTENQIRQQLLTDTKESKYIDVVHDFGFGSNNPNGGLGKEDEGETVVGSSASLRYEAGNHDSMSLGDEESELQTRDNDNRKSLNKAGKRRNSKGSSKRGVLIENLGNLSLVKTVASSHKNNSFNNPRESKSAHKGRGVAADFKSRSPPKKKPGKRDSPFNRNFSKKAGKSGNRGGLEQSSDTAELYLLTDDDESSMIFKPSSFNQRISNSMVSQNINGTEDLKGNKEEGKKGAGQVGENVLENDTFRPKDDQKRDRAGNFKKRGEPSGVVTTNSGGRVSGNSDQKRGMGANLFESRMQSPERGKSGTGKDEDLKRSQTHPHVVLKQERPDSEQLLRAIRNGPDEALGFFDGCTSTKVSLKMESCNKLDIYIDDDQANQKEANNAPKPPSLPRKNPYGQNSSQRNSVTNSLYRSSPTKNGKDQNRLSNFSLKGHLFAGSYIGMIGFNLSGAQLDQILPIDTSSSAVMVKVLEETKQVILQKPFTNDLTLNTIDKLGTLTEVKKLKGNIEPEKQDLDFSSFRHSKDDSFLLWRAGCGDLRIVDTQKFEVVESLPSFFEYKSKEGKPLSVCSDSVAERIVALSRQGGSPGSTILHYYENSNRLQTQYKRPINEIIDDLYSATCIEISRDQDLVFVGGMEDTCGKPGDPLLVCCHLSDRLPYVSSTSIDFIGVGEPSKIKRVLGTNVFVISCGRSVLVFEFYRYKFLKLALLSDLHDNPICDFCLKGENLYSKAIEEGILKVTRLNTNKTRTSYSRKRHSFSVSDPDFILTQNNNDSDKRDIPGEGGDLDDSPLNNFDPKNLKNLKGSLLKSSVGQDIGPGGLAISMGLEDPSVKEIKLNSDEIDSRYSNFYQMRIRIQAVNPSSSAASSKIWSLEKLILTKDSRFIFAGGAGLHRLKQTQNGIFVVDHVDEKCENIFFGMHCLDSERLIIQESTTNDLVVLDKKNLKMVKSVESKQMVSFDARYLRKSFMDPNDDYMIWMCGISSLAIVNTRTLNISYVEDIFPFLDVNSLAIVTRVVAREQGTGIMLIYLYKNCFYIMTIVDGKSSWNQPVSKFLPDFSKVYCLELNKNKDVVFCSGSTYRDSNERTYGCIAAMSFQQTPRLLANLTFTHLDLSKCLSVKRISNRNDLLVGCLKHLLVVKFTGAGFMIKNMIYDVHSGPIGDICLHENRIFTVCREDDYVSDIRYRYL